MKMMLSCEEACRKIASDEYAEAGRWERFNIRIHLWLCGNCRGYQRQLRDMGASVQQLVRDKQPHGADLDRLESKILEALGTRDRGSDDPGELRRR